jgi:ribosomal protein S27AE
MSDMMTQEEAMNMSNEQAVQILIPMRNMMCDQNGCPISDAVFALDKAIEALSADRPQGEWIITEQDNGHKWTHRKCSECGKGVIEPLGVSAMKFCPNCGARMKSSK